MNPETVEVRPAYAADVAAIATLAIEVQAFHASARPDLFKAGGCEPIQEILERIGSSNHLYWVATSGDNVIGYVYARLIDEPETLLRRPSRMVTLEQMGVTTAYQHRGVGRRLWALVEQAATDRDADRIVLNVWAFNDRAVRFYERLGFRPLHQWMAFELRGRKP